MLQGDDRIIIGNLVKVVAILVAVMFFLIAAANFIA